MASVVSAAVSLVGMITELKSPKTIVWGGEGEIRVREEGPPLCGPHGAAVVHMDRQEIKNFALPRFKGGEA